MNHLNKQLEVNHHALEHYLAEQSRKEQLRNKLDRLGLGLMFLCGLLGLFYTTTQSNSIFNRNQKINSNVNLTQQAYATAATSTFTGPESPAAALALAEDSDAIKVVRIQGAHRVGERLDFYIDSFHPKAVYKFHFSDGNTKVAQRDQLSYSFQKPGNYQVQLQVTFEGETQIAFTENLTIR